MKDIREYFTKKPKPERRPRKDFHLAYAWHKSSKKGVDALLFVCPQETLNLIGFKEGDRVNVGILENERLGVFSLAKDGCFTLSKSGSCYRVHIGMRTAIESLIPLFPDMDGRSILRCLEISFQSRAITFQMPETFKLSADTK